MPAKKEDGTPVVLKIGFPGDKEFRTEIEALKIFDGRGIVKLLEYDLDNALMLLEKAVPGDSFKKIQNDDEVTTILSDLIQVLDQPVEKSSIFPTLTDWARGFDRVRKAHNNTSGPFPKNLFEKAEGIFKEYTKDSTQFFLLHGDLHKDNILLSERGWIAIDPKGVLGEREFETAAFLRNPLFDLQRIVIIKK